MSKFFGSLWNLYSTGASIPNNYFIVTSSVLLPLHFDALSPFNTHNKAMTLLLNVEATVHASAF